MKKTNEVILKPWGNYKNIHISNNFIVKILTISPKNKISLQYHTRRAEHWVVTHGKAFVTKGKKQFVLNKNESTYIETNEIHRIENKEEIDLIIVEVQVGSKISEEDIVRLDDIYGRVSKNK